MLRLDFTKPCITDPPSHSRPTASVVPPRPARPSPTRSPKRAHPRQQTPPGPRRAASRRTRTGSCFGQSPAGRDAGVCARTSYPQRGGGGHGLTTRGATLRGQWTEQMAAPSLRLARIPRGPAGTRAHWALGGAQRVAVCAESVSLSVCAGAGVEVKWKERVIRSV